MSFVSCRFGSRVLPPPVKRKPDHYGEEELARLMGHMARSEGHRPALPGELHKHAKAVVPDDRKVARWLAGRGPVLRHHISKTLHIDKERMEAVIKVFEAEGRVRTWEAPRRNKHVGVFVEWIEP